MELVREAPPHRRTDAFLGGVAGWRRAGDGDRRFPLVLARLSAPEASLTFVQAAAQLVRMLIGAPADTSAALARALEARFPTPSPARAGAVARIRAVAEVAALREAGRLSPGAGFRLAWLLDPLRIDTPPADLVGHLGEMRAGELRALRPTLEAEAPTAWRLAAAEYAAHLDRLDPR